MSPHLAPSLRTYLCECAPVVLAAGVFTLAPMTLEEAAVVSWWLTVELDVTDPHTAHWPQRQAHMQHGPMN